MSKRVVRVHTEYDPPVDPGIDCSVEPSQAKQSFRDECDINNIMARYTVTGLLGDDLNDRQGQFADVASSVDYHTAQNIVLQAQEVFNELPSKVRARFRDPGEFLAFIEDPSNREEAIELGLVSKAAEGAAGAGCTPHPSAAAAPSGAASRPPEGGS